MTDLIRQIRYRTSRTKIRYPLVWVRHRGLSSKDLFIASYMRSGFTWLKFLLFEIFTGHSSTFPDAGHAIPYVGKHSGAPPFLDGGGRLIQTHEPYRKEYKRAIC